MVPPAPGDEGRIAIVQVATIDPRQVIEALESAGFEVGWPSLETDLRQGGGA